MTTSPKETATAFVLRYLGQWPENEMQIAHLFDGCGGRFTKPNLLNACTRLLAAGKIVKANEGRAAWYAIRR